MHGIAHIRKYIVNVKFGYVLQNEVLCSACCSQAVFLKSQDNSVYHKGLISTVVACPRTQ